MKKQLLLILILFSSFYSFSQISYEKGYFITNAGEKIDCYIKNDDWKNNPSEFQYKLTETSEKKLIKVNNVKAFEIYNASKYERHTVFIDVSIQNLYELGDSKKPKWREKQLFLKVLMEGKASLYSFVNSNLRKYFFRINNEKIQQLIYKKYMTPENKIGENVEFKKQLWDHLKCDAITTKKIKNTTYTKGKLVKLFATYNTCDGESYTNLSAKDNKNNFNLSIKPGINFSSFELGSTINPRYNIDFGQNTGLQLGLEAEIVLNFNKNKWALVAEPTYISYNSEKEVIYSQTLSGASSTTNVMIDYSAIEIPIGVRHYFFLNDTSKLFINASYMFNIVLKRDLEAERTDFLDVQLEPRGNYAFGFGYKYNNKYSIEFRYKTTRKMLPPNGFFELSDYNSAAVVFGYTIF